MVKDRKQAGRQGFNDKATMACWTGTIVELAIILGHRSSAYLSQQFNIGAIRTLNIIFMGLYGFMDSIWFVGSIALGIYIIALVKYMSNTHNKGSKIALAFCMLGMLLGVYSIDIVEKHLADLSIGTRLILNTFENVDSGVLAGGVLLLIIACGIVYVGFKTYISVKESTFLENEVSHLSRQSRKNLKLEEAVEKNDEEKAERTQVDVSEGKAETTTITDVGEKAKQEANTSQETTVVSARSREGKFVLGAIFLLLLPILTVLVFTILQSSWLSEIEILEKYKNKFQNNQTIDLIVEWAIPWAMVCTAILVAAGIAFVIITIYQCIKNEKLVHPQALFAVILEATLIAASPILKKIDAFNSLLEMMVDGGVINTLIALVVFYFAILTFLVLLFAPKTSGTESFENVLREKCTNLFGRIQNVAVGLLDSGVRIIEFATMDYLKAILGMFGIQDNPSASVKNQEQPKEKQ